MRSNGGKERKFVLLLIVIICMLFLTGCWGKREVEELDPLIGIGIDPGQKPGTYLITEQLAKPKQGGANATEIEDRTFSIEASSAREAYEKIYMVSNRIPFMGSLKVIIIGEDAAKSGFNEILDFAQRFSEFRRTMYLVISKEKAQSLLNMKLRNGQMPSMSIKNHMEQGENLSTFPTVRLGHYLTVLGTQSMAPIIPAVQILESGDENTEYKEDKGKEIMLTGAGVLHGDKLVDFLTDEETKGYMWLEDNVVHRYINTAEMKGNEVNFGGQVLKSTTKYNVSNNNGTIGLQYQIKTDISVDEVAGLNKQLSETEWSDLMQEAERSYAKAIQKECELSIQKERELGLDFLGIGRHIEQRNSGYWKTVKDQWEEKIANFPVSLNVKVTVHHSGMSSNSATTNSTGEGEE